VAGKGQARLVGRRGGRYARISPDRLSASRQLAIDVLQGSLVAFLYGEIYVDSVIEQCSLCSL
jgi:hypothetical protein